MQEKKYFLIPFIILLTMMFIFFSNESKKIHNAFYIKKQNLLKFNSLVLNSENTTMTETIGNNLYSHYYQEMIRQKSIRQYRAYKRFLNSFFDTPELKNTISIDLNKRKIFIDENVSEFPVLIEFDKQMKSYLQFPLRYPALEIKLRNFLMTYKNKTSFLVIDKCKNLLKIDNSLGSNGYCLIAGKGRKYHNSFQIKSNIKIDFEDIQYFLGMASPKKFYVNRIAHGAGGINGTVLTNSLEALEANRQKGFKYFEIDFSFTKDGHLVCMHDWDESFKKIFGYNLSHPLSLEEFKNLLETNNAYHACTLESLSSWMKENPSVVVITDIKEHNLKGLKIISEQISEYQRRIIPEIFDPETIEIVRNLGFERFIFSIYQSKLNDQEILKLTKTVKGPMALAIPVERAESYLPELLKSMGIPTFVHTVNSVEEKERLMKEFEISEIYTDFLVPY